MSSTPPQRPPNVPDARRRCPNAFLRPPCPPTPHFPPHALHAAPSPRTPQDLQAQISVPKKQTKSKKKKVMTSAHRDAADEEANETTVEHLTA
ncbi:hypothetical protein EYR40_002388 [Pleurotus pulmonarius]|nr:hypothetical protein EYR40_002388 [Pleurotus pulmonarius]